ncbi:MAG: hypothetical protein ACI9WU_003914 [Myxococcota bacterium]|jgi:hypothetical protein
MLGLFPDVLQAGQPKDTLTGIASAELLLARAEHAALRTRYGPRHASIQEVGARIERLARAVPPALVPAAVSARRDRLQRALTRFEALYAERSIKYGPKHPAMAALRARIATIQADVGERARLLPRKSAHTPVSVEVQLARLEGIAAFHDAKRYGARHPEVMARMAAARALRRARSQLPGPDSQALLTEFGSAVMEIDDAITAARRAMRWAEIRKLHHERDALLMRALTL